MGHIAQAKKWWSIEVRKEAVEFTSIFQHYLCKNLIFSERLFHNKMANLEAASENESRQPTGSSKRKRKQSIKRNVVSEENSDRSSVKFLESENTCEKKIEVEKRESGQIAYEISSSKCENDEPSCPIFVKVNILEREGNTSKPMCEEEEEESVKVKCKDKKSGDSLATHCNLTKQECQNCKFCSDHKQIKQGTICSMEKQSKTKKKFSCEICAKVFNSLEKHNEHMATVHEIYNEDVKRFECTDCPESVWFPTKSKFIYHLGTKHPGIIRFVCEVCTESFKLKTNYKNHMKNHNIVVKKKFSCDVCNGTFVNKAGFEAHKKRFPGPHMKQSCSHCGFSFSREKHMKNHRCKTLQLEEAAARANAQLQESSTLQETDEPVKITGILEVKSAPSIEDVQVLVDKKSIDSQPEEDLLQKKLINEDPQTNKRVVVHRIIPRRNQEQTVYRPVQMQSQSVPESVVVQELREIDFEGGTFIATAEPEQQFIVRDINGQLVQGNQILHLDINDVQAGEESQVYLADWNIVAPYVIREKSP